VAALGLLLIKANSPKVAPAFKEATIYQQLSSSLLSTDVVLTDFNVSAFDILLVSIISYPSIILISAFEPLDDNEFLSVFSIVNPYNTCD
jgi:hypothetical protein